MDATIRYGRCPISKDGFINAEEIQWKTGTEEDACESVRREGGCVLFFPGDVPGKGVPVDKDVSRTVFEVLPAQYGVCYYKTWNGSYVYE